MDFKSRQNSRKMDQNKPPMKQVTVNMGPRVPLWMNGIEVRRFNSEIGKSRMVGSKNVKTSVLKPAQDPQPLSTTKMASKTSNVPASIQKPMVTVQSSTIGAENSALKMNQTPKSMASTSNPLLNRNSITQTLVAAKNSALAATQPALTVGNAAAMKSNLLDSIIQLNQLTKPMAGPAPKPPPKPKRLTKAQQRARIALGLTETATDDDATKDKEPLDDDKAEDQMGVTETYADYKPAKLTYGQPHPDAVVETASLSSVAPTDITYELSIPKKVIKKGALSALQLESIVYASQAHQHLLPDGSRAGFLIGDGAGVGKGRTVAGVIFENFQLGRTKAIWISVSNDLKYDAERDLDDIGAVDIQVYHLNKFKYGKIDSAQNGRVKRGVVFSTYSSLISGTNAANANAQLNTRLKQLVDWCGTDFDGVIVFDECHKAKHLIPTGSSKPTKTGMNVLELQNQLPKARVVYASATGASEPRNMAYMVRLGLWGAGTPFRNFPEFLQTVERRGVSAMEIVAMDMKLRGMYIARQLSFKGVTFNVEEVQFTDEFKQTYNDSVDLWVKAKNYFSEAEALLGNNNMLKKMMWGQYWSAHQRFFKYLCIASKVSHAVKVAKQAIKDGKCAVIGLQSTGEARTLDIIDRDDGELTDFISTAKSVFEMLIEKQFPAPEYGFLDGDTRDAKNLKKKSPSPLKRRGSNLKRKVLNSLNLRNPAKKARVVYSDDSDDEEDKQMDLGDESDTDNDKSDDLTVKEDSSGSESGSSSSDGDNESSDFSTPSESELSLIDDKAKDDDEDDEEDSDFEMELVRTGRGWPRATGRQPPKQRTMQQKVQEIVLQQQAEASLNRPGLSAHMLQSYCKRACEMKDELLYKIEKLGRQLPPNTLDQLIAELGGSDEVAEMTGRKGRVVRTDDDEVQYETRVEGGVTLEKMNLLEKKRFMDGDKLIAIISEAASNGISLQSDRRAKNQRRRVHITLELPWSADRAIQQFGRTHRSNQVNAPEYIFLISKLAGERRFASSVSKRLESLGALTHADRRATETRNLSQFNVDNKYGREALHTVLEQVMSVNYTPMPDGDEERYNMLRDIYTALQGVDIDEPIDKIDMSRFLNRILGMPVDLQNYLFEYFTDTLDAVIERAKRAGKYDMGIMDMGNTDKAEKIQSTRFLRKHATGVAPVELTTVALERGLSWEEAAKKATKITHDREGFYMLRYQRNTSNRSVCLALLVDPDNSIDKLAGPKAWNVEFQVHRPHTGTQVRYEPLEEVIRKGYKVTAEEAKQYWERHYEASVQTCSHKFWSGRCKNEIIGVKCDTGLRRRRYTVLSGSIFAIWSRIEHQLRANQTLSIQVIRMKTIDGGKIVGVLLPDDSVENIIDDLSQDSEEVLEKSFVVD